MERHLPIGIAGSRPRKPHARVESIHDSHSLTLGQDFGERAAHCQVALFPLPNYHNFVMDCDLFLASPKTYPVAAGLMPLLEGIAKGGLRHEVVKKTGCVVAGLYAGRGVGCGITTPCVAVLDGGMASIWFVGGWGGVVLACAVRVCCWWSGFGGWGF